MKAEIASDMPYFLGYLQKRMDFIAQVATSAPSWCIATSFDELIERFNVRICLVNNIIRSHQGLNDGPDFKPKFERKYPEKSVPSADVPHGQVGVQAFYTILENILRNTAKYGSTAELNAIKDPTQDPGDGKLRFTVWVRDDWEAQHRIWVENYYQVSIIEQIKTETSPTSKAGVVTALNKFLAEELTNPVTGIVNPRHWGMKEIKICAAYLRMVKQDQIDDKFSKWADGHDEHEPPIISVSLENIEREDGTVKGNLAYTLYLLRPKRALVVIRSSDTSETLTMPSEEVRGRFRRVGIEFTTLGEFIKHVDGEGVSPRHAFLVLPKPNRPFEWNWLSEKLNFLPPRLILRDADDAELASVGGQLARSVGSIESLSIRTPSELMNQLMEAWIGKWWPDFEIAVRWSRASSTVAELEIPGAPRGRDYVAPEGKSLLVFDHLGSPDTTTLFRQAAYHQSFSHDGASSLSALLMHSHVSSDDGTTETSLEQNRFRLRETAALSIAIIDERVWLEKDGPAPTFGKYTEAFRTRKQIWEKRRVFLQDTNAALHDFEAFVANLTAPDRGVFDFIIIHQGILDGVREKLGQKRFEKTAVELRSQARWLVVDSGRGQPEHALAGNLRWVEYSNLAECIIQNAGDKFRLAELLWTLRASSASGAR